MPVVPQVDVHRAGTLRDEEQEVDAQTDGDDQRADGGVIGHGGGSRPAHVEHAELQVVEFADGRQRTAEVVGQQGRHDAQTHETDTHIEARLQRLAERHAYAEADDGKEDRHHHRCAQTDNVTEYLFHCLIVNLYVLVDSALQNY